MAIAWHPYFNLPSGDRTQAGCTFRRSTMAEVDGYDNVFPTGKVLPVEGTRFDLRAAGGKALGKEFFDDNWSHLDWKDGAATVQVIDPAAHYGVKIEGLSPEIKAIQMYAPPDQAVRGHRAPVQLRRPLRQGVGHDRYRHGDAEAGREHQVACAAAGVCAVGASKESYRDKNGVSGTALAVPHAPFQIMLLTGLNEHMELLFAEERAE